mgnify:CR=1 FL=1
MNRMAFWTWHVSTNNWHSSCRLLYDADRRASGHKVGFLRLTELFRGQIPNRLLHHAKALSEIYYNLAEEIRPTRCFSNKRLLSLLCIGFYFEAGKLRYMVKSIKYFTENLMATIKFGTKGILPLPWLLHTFLYLVCETFTHKHVISLLIDF